MVSCRFRVKGFELCLGLGPMDTTLKPKLNPYSQKVEHVHAFSLCDQSTPRMEFEFGPEVDKTLIKIKMKLVV